MGISRDGRLPLSPGSAMGPGPRWLRESDPVSSLSKEATVPYDSIISRTDADSLIPQGQADAVIKAATQESAALTLFNRAQLSTKVSRQPVMSALPVAYWVAGDTGLKQTTEAAWAGVDLVAEEIACMVPIPEAVVDDSSFDVWGELRPALAEAVAQVLDAAAIGGINKPASWPAATSARSTTERSWLRAETCRPVLAPVLSPRPKRCRFAGCSESIRGHHRSKSSCLREAGTDFDRECGREDSNL
jgi:hypothetical protein